MAIPQNFATLMTVLTMGPPEQRPNGLFFLWFRAEKGAVVNGQKTAGAIECVATSSGPFDPSMTLAEYAEAAGVTPEWNMALVWSAVFPNGAPPHEWIEAEQERKLKEFAEGSFLNLRDAVFDRDGNRIHEIDFPDLPPS